LDIYLKELKIIKQLSNEDALDEEFYNKTQKESEGVIHILDPFV
jgi:hypothetical protein